MYMNLLWTEIPMKNVTGKAAIISLVAVLVAIAVFFLYTQKSGHEKVSRFGEYRGYSEEVYDGYVRRSDYLKLSDGTRLAYDLILPTKKGIPAIW